ncbi:MAG: hypothetical protein IPJ39_21155 [Saprospiraceae bacterium]|nr:hypothetical protein [Saprospiraceae bacterium]
MGKLKTPYPFIAADVNNDGKISANDLAELRNPHLKVHLMDLPTTILEIR